MSPSAHHHDSPKHPGGPPAHDRPAPLGPPGWDEFAAARDRFWPTGPGMRSWPGSSRACGQPCPGPIDAA